MGKYKRLAFVAVLLLYLSLGLTVICLFAPTVPKSQANEDFIRSFLDSLKVDSSERQGYTKYSSSRYDSLKNVWAKERAEREARRQQRYDSAMHYWDSVRHERDSVKAERDSIYRSRKTTTQSPIDLTMATVDSLRRVPGIGEVLAQQIIEYRVRLGGFVNVQQVLEVENVPSEVLAYLTLSDTVVKRIYINQASPQYMRSHPYISGAQAYAILDARRKYGRIAGWHELLRLPEFTVQDKVRLQYYLDFGDNRLKP